MLAIYKKELKGYFSSMLGYIYLAIFMLIVGIYFIYYNVIYYVTDFSGYALSGCKIIFIMLVPVMTMRSFASERKNKTDQLLLTSPVSVTEIVIAKYLAAVTLFAISTVFTVIYPVIISFFGKVDIGYTICGYLGFFLYGCCLFAIGIFISTLTEYSIVAAIVSAVVFLVIHLCDAFIPYIPLGKPYSIAAIVIVIAVIAVLFYLDTKKIYISAISTGVLAIAAVIWYFVKTSWYDSGLSTVLTWLSLSKRSLELSNGLLNVSNIVFFVAFIAVFLFMSIQTVQKRRWK